MNKTYNNIIETIKCLGNAHQQVNTVTVGDVFDIDLEKNTIYPLMHINPTSTDVGRSELTLNFQIFIMDLVEPDESNEQEVLSDTMQMAIDILSLFQHSSQLNSAIEEVNIEYSTSETFSLEPFTERFDNSVTGWVFSLPITVMNDMQTCSIPIDNIDCSK